MCDRSRSVTFISARARGVSVLLHARLDAVERGGTPLDHVVKPTVFGIQLSLLDELPLPLEGFEVRGRLPPVPFVQEAPGRGFVFLKVRGNSDELHGDGEGLNQAF
jgi:hypothetical protein